MLINGKLDWSTSCRFPKTVPGDLERLAKEMRRSRPCLSSTTPRHTRNPTFTFTMTSAPHHELSADVETFDLAAHQELRFELVRGRSRRASFGPISRADDLTDHRTCMTSCSPVLSHRAHPSFLVVLTRPFSSCARRTIRRKSRSRSNPARQKFSVPH